MRIFKKDFGEKSITYGEALDKHCVMVGLMAKRMRMMSIPGFKNSLCAKLKAHGLKRECRLAVKNFVNNTLWLSYDNATLRPMNPTDLKHQKELNVFRTIPWQEVCKFLAGGFFVNAGILFYLYVARVSVPLWGTGFIETPEVSGVRSIVHAVLFLTFFYLGFIRGWKSRNRNAYSVLPIGFIRSALKCRDEAPWQGLEGAPDAFLEILPAYLEGLDRMQCGDEIIVITWLHRARRDVLKVHPRMDPSNPLT
jgi:hypothetical protein